MTSITEYSFASKGQIRSVHMLNEPAGPSDDDDPDNIALFELYIMHSTGVCVLRIRRSDLGWKKDGEPINPKEAEEEGVITISQLKPPQLPTDESSTTGDTSAPAKSVSDRSAREIVKKESSIVSKQASTSETAPRTSPPAKIENKQDATRVTTANGSEQRPEKKKKKRSTAETTTQVPAVAPISTRPPQSYAQVAQAIPPSKSPVPPETLNEPESCKAYPFI